MSFNPDNDDLFVGYHKDVFGDLLRVDRNPLPPVESQGEGVELDEAVMAVLPDDCTVVSVTPGDHSGTVSTAVIQVLLPSGETKYFFKKTADNALVHARCSRNGTASAAAVVPGVSRLTMRNSYTSDLALWTLVPELTARPVGWGTYESDSDLHFFIAEHVPMTPYVPAPPAEQWARIPATLHARSLGKCPRGRSGWYGNEEPVSVSQFYVMNQRGWMNSWTAWYQAYMREVFEQCVPRFEADGHWNGEGGKEERVRFDKLARELVDVVVPRFLKPLESEGRELVPVLLHGDLWVGNTQQRTGEKEGEVVTFDSVVIWGHHEYDLSGCRTARWGLGRAHVESYLAQGGIPPSEPRDEFDARSQLYMFKFIPMWLAEYPEDRGYYDGMIREMEELVAKAKA